MTDYTEYTVHEWADGTRYWYLNDKLHRVDGPAAEWSNGTREWYLNGKRHRTDGPAIERSDGTRMWWLDGKLHRVEGPAVEYVDGTRAWYLHGKHLTEQEHARLTSPDVEMTLAEVCEALGKNVKIVKG